MIPFELEIIARKKCTSCKQYMSSDILSPICLKCYELKRMFGSK